MSNRDRLALHIDTDHAHDNLGDDCTNAIAPIEVDPNAVSDIEFRMRVSVRLIEVERLAEQTRRAVNRILLRFALDGRPIPEDANAA